MQKPNIRPIRATRDHGCVLACLAMVLGRSEDDIDRDFRVDFNQKGVTCKVAQEYLTDQGLSVIDKTARSSNDIKRHNKRMLTPFAQAHIVTIQPEVDCKANHSMVMTQAGKIIDPARPPYEHYYYVLNVIGIFYD
jgi:hypothetical protein